MIYILFTSTTPEYANNINNQSFTELKSMSVFIEFTTSIYVIFSTTGRSK